MLVARVPTQLNPVLQLPKGLGFDLPDAFPCEPEDVPDLLQGHPALVRNIERTGVVRVPQEVMAVREGTGPHLVGTAGEAISSGPRANDRQPDGFTHARTVWM